MRNPGLLALFVLSLLRGPASAQTPPAAVTEARETLTRLEAAVGKGDQKTARELLARFQPKVASFKPEAAARLDAWRKLDKAAAETLRGERELAPGSKEIAAQFDLLFPREQGRPGSSRAAPVPPRPDGVRDPHADAAAAAIARSNARGALAASNPERAFDNAANRGPQAVQAVGPGAASSGLRRDDRPIEPVQTLRTHPVPPPTGEEVACRQAAGGGMFAGTCGWKIGKSAGPLAAGVLDAFKEQFGTAKGLAMNLLFLVGGLLLGAVTGGIGALVKVISIIRALATAAVLFTIGALLYQLLQAGKTIFSTSKEDPAHWRAIRKVGEIGGQAMAIALMALIGYKIGSKPPGQAAVGAMEKALVEKAGAGEAQAAANEMRTALHEAPAESPTPKIKPPEPPPAAERAPVGNSSHVETATRPNPLKAPHRPSGQKTKASEWKKWAEDQGWEFSQSENGPPQYFDKSGVKRLEIKSGSARTPGSETPHISLRNAEGKTIDPETGSVVTRRSAENHTQIDWDLP